MHAVFFLFPLCELAKLPASDVFQWPNSFLLSWFYLLRLVILSAVGDYITCLCVRAQFILAGRVFNVCGFEPFDIAIVGSLKKGYLQNTTFVVRFFF